MKFFLLFLLIAALSGIYTACHKDINTGNEASTIGGRWAIIVDSIPEGAGATSHISAYHGKDNDYYDFRSDSNLSIKENDVLSVYPYHIHSDSSLTIVLSDEYSDSIPVTFHVSRPDGSSLNLITGWLYSPGGVMGRAVYLKR